MQRWIASTLVAMLLALAAAWYTWPAGGGRTNVPRVDVMATVPVDATYELFFDDGNGFSAAGSVRTAVKAAGGPQRISFELPPRTGAIHGLRLDPGDLPVDIQVQSIELHGPHRSITWAGEVLPALFGHTHHLSITPLGSAGIMLHCTGADPFFLSTDDLAASTADVMDPRTHGFADRLPSIALALVVLVVSWSLLRWATSPGLFHGRPVIGRRTVVLLVIDAVLFVAAFGVAQRIHEDPNGLALRIRAVVLRDDVFQVFYADRQGQFNPSASVVAKVHGSPAPQWIDLRFPRDTIKSFLRFDPGSRQDSIVILAAELAQEDADEPLPLQELMDGWNARNDVPRMALANGGLTLYFSGPDPYLALDTDLHKRATAVRDRGLPFWLPLLSALALVLLAHAGLHRSAVFGTILDTARVRDLVLVCGFLLCSMMPLLTVFNPRIEPPQVFSEKRRLTALPPLQLGTLGRFPKQYDAWYRDHFGMRGELFRWNSWFHVKVLHTSSLPDRVIMGKDGWFFQYNAEVDGDYRGRRLYSFDELEAIRHIYEERRDRLAAKGIRYYILVPPLSANMNREHMPDRFHRVSGLTWLDQVKAHFDRYSTVPIIDVRPALEEAKRKQDVYFATDIHWNPWGAYCGYHGLIERIAQDEPSVGRPWPLSDLRFDNETNTSADLAQMLGLNDVLTRVEPITTPLRPRQATFSHFPELPGAFYFLDKPQTYVLPDTTKPRLLMFHDSFGLYLKPLLSEHFSRSTYVWSGLFIPDVVEAEKPDIVVQEFMEMFVVNMPKDTVHLSVP